jgi:hypothetical protein
MFFDDDLKEITKIPNDILRNLTNEVTSINWDISDFDRKEVTLLEGRLCLLPFLISKPEQLINTDSREKIWFAVSPIIDFIKDTIPDGKIIRGEVVNLSPRRSLTPHIDVYWFHRESRRIHIPIITNDQCFLTFEDRHYHLAVGSIYEINNRIVHSAFNNGLTDRVHVILDIMNLNLYNDALLTKQNFMEKV